MIKTPGATSRHVGLHHDTQGYITTRDHATWGFIMTRDQDTWSYIMTRGATSRHMGLHHDTWSYITTRGATSRHVGLHHDGDRKPVCHRPRSGILINDDPIGPPLPASRKGLDLHPPIRRRRASRSDWEVNGEPDRTGKKLKHSKALMQANTICRQQSIILVYI